MNLNIKQGEDLLVQLPVTDESNNQVDLSTATKIRLSLYIKGQKAKSYMSPTLEGSALTGYGELEVNATDSHIIDMQLIREDTKNFPVGDMVAYVLVEEPGSTLANIRNEYKFDIGVVEKGVLKDEELN